MKDIEYHQSVHLIIITAYVWTFSCVSHVTKGAQTFFSLHKFVYEPQAYSFIKDPAPERLFSSVYSHMLFQVESVPKCTVTQTAWKWFFSSVILNSN